ncbi:MAG TPA: DUF1508 domain-containing protein [Xanthobacteraceae bacterium]|nr:DUF1508 domain-containing protein [Xanthobacteraceae bacterium]
MNYVVWKEESSKQFKWTLYTDNNRKVCESIERYYNRQDAHEAIRMVKGSAHAPVSDR